MVWSQGDNANSQNSYQRIYDLDLTQPRGVDADFDTKANLY